MRPPKLATQAKWLKEKTDNAYVQFIGIPFFFFLPPGLIVSYYSSDAFKKAALAFLPDGADTFMTNHVFAITFLGLLVSYIASNVNAILDRITSSSNNLPAHGFIALKEAFEQIVLQKARRFDAEENNLLQDRGTKPQASKIFESITKPEQQIIFIAHTLHNFLETITTNIDFKVRIIKVVNNLPAEWYTFAPDDNPPKTDISVLQEHDSAVSHCLRRKAMFVVEDINTAAHKPGGREYVMAHQDPAEEVGSLLCYPIYHKQSKCYPFVITVSANKPYFRKSKTELYKWILEQFALRIRLEYSLILLKEHCKNVQAQ